LMFLAVRLLTLMSFPVFSDEGTHIQFAQMMRSDFQTYRFITCDNVFRDWKPPLMCWLGSVFVGLFKNPLISVRFLAFLYSILGFAGIYYLTLELYDRRAALWVALLFVLCPAVLMYNNQFIAETFVFSTAPVYYFFCLRALRRPGYAWLFIPPAAASGAALLLFKQSGALYLYLSALLLFAVPLPGRRVKAAKKTKRCFLSGPLFRGTAGSLLLIAVIVVISILIYKAVIPSPIEANRQRFTSRWTLSLREVLEFPAGKWLSNIEGAGSYYTHYYTAAVFPLVLGFLVHAFVLRDRSDIVISALFIVSSAAIIFGMKKYSEAIYNTATVIFTIIMAGRFLSILTLRPFPRSVGRRVLRSVFLFFFAVLVAHWLYQIALIKSSPVRYAERGSRWMRGNYLEDWPGGFGIDGVVEFLKEQPPRSIAFVDPQWGNPGTALQVFAPLYPQVTVVPIGRSLFDPDLKEKLERRGFSRRFVIYKPWGEKQRMAMERYINENLCANGVEYMESEKQIPVVVCTF